MCIKLTRNKINKRLSLKTGIYTNDTKGRHNNGQQTQEVAFSLSDQRNEN